MASTSNKNNFHLSAVRQWTDSKAAIAPCFFFGTLLLKDVIDFLDDRRAIFVVDSRPDGEYAVYVSSLHDGALKSFVEQAQK